VRTGNVDLRRDVLVVAEIGNNHEGDFGLAQELIHAAAGAGVQGVKFQTIIPERLVSQCEPARIAQLKRYAFDRDQFTALADEARRAGVMFLSTPFAVEVVPWLDALVPAFKIASGDNDFANLLEAVAATGKPIILSTGMASIEQIKKSCAIIENAAAPRASPEIVLLHCVSAYPTPPAQANLLAIASLARATDRTVGYSDHTLGIEAAVLSVALGARLIEKHFTLSKTQSDFRDHALSADPDELAELVRCVKLAQVLLGNGDKIVQEAERSTVAAARRSIVARSALSTGHVLTLADLDWLRPGGGLAPGDEHRLLGRKLSRPVTPGEKITPEMIT
jgi:N,N'-diacetyllegionaminate synthase